MDSEQELELISLITELVSFSDSTDRWYTSIIHWGVASFITEIISLVRSMDMDLLPKPHSELMSVVSQTISLVSSMDLDSQPKQFSEVISRITKLVNPEDSDSDLDSDFEYYVDQTLDLETEKEPELMSLIHQIFSIVISMNSEWDKLICLCPQVIVRQRRSDIYVNGEISWRSSHKWHCLPLNWRKIKLTGEEATHFLCRGCNGQYHEETEKVQGKIKHPLHPKHFLQLVLLEHAWMKTRTCYCCDDYLKEFFYYCSACDYAMNVACVEKPPLLSIDHPKRHEHTLARLARTTSITCDVCALTHSRCPFYICPPCSFVVHQKCIDLPFVIKISRHRHRVSFTPSFDHGEWFCGVCRREIDNDCGGYTCIKDRCSYAAHSKCATQSNVWDGEELEGVPEEIEEEVDPFVRISDGIIQHFTHQRHHLKINEDTNRDYDENKECQACLWPIYFGNFYSCMQCNFILHEECANLSRKIHHPIHPHRLTLVGACDVVTDNRKDSCSSCNRQCASGLVYKCCKEGCHFRLHVQCAIISEPLVHASHMHPLFLTSKPEEARGCSVCGDPRGYITYETFNCIEDECDFALCFTCATIPQKVRYKHDKHMLTLSYGEETRGTMENWCEVCEKRMNLEKGFYRCDEYCNVTLHIECLIGKELYMKLGSSWFYKGKKISVLPNNQHMSRPFCSFCKGISYGIRKERCPHKIVFQMSGLIFCSTICIHRSISIERYKLTI